MIFKVQPSHLLPKETTFISKQIQKFIFALPKYVSVHPHSVIRPVFGAHMYVCTSLWHAKPSSLLPTIARSLALIVDNYERCFSKESVFSSCVRGACASTLSNIYGKKIKFERNCEGSSGSLDR